MDVRYSFTAQFLMGSAMFARRARCIEEEIKESVTEEMQMNHRAFVVSAVMQSVASIEAEIAEILLHGPGHHLGSNGIDAEARDYLLPIADIIDHQNILDKYDVVLHILKKLPIEKGSEPCQSLGTLIRLRNELVHYKSIWGKDQEEKKLIKELKSLRFAPNPLFPDNVNFFPHKILNSSCACWAVKTAVNFINVFHDRLCIKSPLDAYSDRLVVPDIILSN